MQLDSARIENIALIRESAAAVVPKGGDLRRIRALRFDQPGFDLGVWREICGMGWVGLRVPEDQGGSGLGMREFCALIEELGAGLVPEPLIYCAMAARALKGVHLDALLSGNQIIIPAWQESGNSLTSVAEARFARGRVNGRKVFVPMAAGADGFLVTTREGLALVARDAPGVACTIMPTQDGGHFGMITFENAAAELVEQDPGDILEEAILATSAYLLGVMERAFSITLDYLKIRKQFGRPIGSFQALQHRVVDLKIQIALTRASLESAADIFDVAQARPLRMAAASRAKARAAHAAMLVTRQSIQLHGAIGYTDEYDVGLYLRKAMVLANLFGSADLHRARYAELTIDG